MWAAYRQLSNQYPKISLEEERSLIAQAKKGSQKKAEELVLRHIQFLASRIHKKVFSNYRERFGEDMLSEVIIVLYDKIKTYDLDYKDRQGNPKPVRFASYVWKRIDGFIIDSLKGESQRDKNEESSIW